MSEKAKAKARQAMKSMFAFPRQPFERDDYHTRYIHTCSNCHHYKSDDKFCAWRAQDWSKQDWKREKPLVDCCPLWDGDDSVEVIKRTNETEESGK